MGKLKPYYTFCTKFKMQHKIWFEQIKKKWESSYIRRKDSRKILSKKTSPSSCVALKDSNIDSWVISKTKFEVEFYFKINFNTLVTKLFIKVSIFFSI